MLTYDRQITISAAGNRRALRWPQQTMYWSEMVDKLRTPARGVETLAVYLRMPKSKQDDLKDVGGFVGGALQGGLRRSGCVLGRDIITLDLDNIQPGGTNDALQRIEALGCAYTVYSTRKHEEYKPRLRVLIPLFRTATADEYEPLARKMASLIGIELCDPTTFQALRLMYWPSCCADSQYVFTFADKPFLDVDGVLAMYQDWRNINEWPEVPGVVQSHIKLAAKQGNPVEKPGVVGAFCRVYDIYGAINAYLFNEYIPCDDGSGRYTYVKGSTTGGAVVYDNGNFLYSHHATDPAGGKLSNAFDLVRYHRYGDLDDDSKPDTPTNKLPSYIEMCKLAVADPLVSTLLNQERYDKATEDFSSPLEEDPNWIQKLKISPMNGRPENTADNILIILENDPLLKGKIAFDEFAGRMVVMGPVPWDQREGRRVWKDKDDSGTRWYLERVHSITSNPKTMDAVVLCADRHSFDDVKDYLKSLSWDGVRRLDTLLIDYLGAADSPYVRAVTRKAFTAAVARAMVPGCKYDIMTVLTGPQGIGKSTLIKKMARSWFTDSLKTFEGKEASELVQGVWIVEISEMEALQKSEIGRIKQFLSQSEDMFRGAYKHHVDLHPRRCVFFGTSNNSEYLRDKTGNRRFWPVDLQVTEASKSVFRDLDDEIDQLWAEAFTYWQLGEALYLTGSLEETAVEEQEAHRERSAREGFIRGFVEKEVPLDWYKWSLERRRMFWADGFQDEKIVTAPRNRICALEVWCEALNGEIKFMKYQDAAEINSVIASMEGWKRCKNTGRYGYCEVQRGFEKM